MILNENEEPILKQKFSVDTGTLFTINIKTKKLYSDGDEIVDISSSFTPQKLEFIRAGGSYQIVFGKKLQAFAAKIKKDIPNVYAPFKKYLIKIKALLLLRKFLIKMHLELMTKYYMLGHILELGKHCWFSRHNWSYDFSRVRDDGSKSDIS